MKGAISTFLQLEKKLPEERKGLRREWGLAT